MDNTRARLYSTDLTDRTLWYDGESSYDPTRLLELVRKYDIKHVDYMTPIVEQYNRSVGRADKISVKENCNPLSHEWIIPEEYKQLDIIEYIATKHSELIADLEASGAATPREIEEREHRLAVELYKYDKRQLFDVLRVIVYIINTLSAQHAVWGVGRGSSVSSYVLYVLGVHDVDSFVYDLDVDDFLHD